MCVKRTFPTNTRQKLASRWCLNHFSPQLKNLFFPTALHCYFMIVLRYIKTARFFEDCCHSQSAYVCFYWRKKNKIKKWVCEMAEPCFLFYCTSSRFLKKAVSITYSLNCRWSLSPRLLFLDGLVQFCCRRTKLRPSPFPKFRKNTHHIHLQVTLTSKSAPEKQHRFRTPSKILYLLRVQKAKKLLVASLLSAFILFYLLSDRSTHLYQEWERNMLRNWHNSSSKLL